MKVAAFGDIHGQDITGARRVIEENDVDAVLGLSDFDQTAPIHQYREMEEELKGRGIPVYTVPGNHDDAVLNGIDIRSGTMRAQGKTAQELHRELYADDVARRYLEDLFDAPAGTSPNRIGFPLVSEQTGEEFQTLLIHGAYEGDLSSYPGCPPEKRDFWRRISGESDYEENFDTMNAKGHDIMIRGHDHEPEFAYRDTATGEITVYTPAEDGESYRLKKDRRHIITTGAWFDGWMLVLDTDFPGEERPVAQYRHIDQ